ncbi:glycoside hydrolase family 36 protein [Streptomyces atratus]|uniref:glycoside hydrolase family 36 protein n=1 Tax=Streptomyces atratus TaxID=1893 RepID=UPI00368D4DBA
MDEVWEPHARRLAGTRRRISAGCLELEVVGGTPVVRALDDSVIEVTLTHEDGDGSGTAGRDVRVSWLVPCTRATALWTPLTSGTHWIPAAWSPPRPASLSKGAPVASLVGSGDAGLCTFAASRIDAVVGAGVVEETGDFHCWVQASGAVTVRIDMSGRHFARCLADVAAWWGGGETYRIPGIARMPAYSTWYSMHQNVGPERVETQAALAKELGCEVIIVDDGWMTEDRARGYGHCGDWEPLSLPDTAAHVERVHGLGMAYLLWYALPIVGRDSAAWKELEPYLLRRVDFLDAGVADPRYPVVREHLAERVARSVAEWGMDGVKFDFIDWFAARDGFDPNEAYPPGPEADCAVVSEGVQLLLAEIHARLAVAHPAAMVENRQPYVSPGLWPYSTMIRATDCPLNPTLNRTRTLDLRLIAGPLAVHSDMLMWHPSETAEQIGVHLISVLFSVPQISVDLAAQTVEQREALAFWLSVFRGNADVLQLGVLEPSRPELCYPIVRAHDGASMVVARYAPLPVEVPAVGWSKLLVANADASSIVFLLGGPEADAEAVVQDARGRRVWSGLVRLGAGSTTVDVPTGGLLTLTADSRAVLDPSIPTL